MIEKELKRAFAVRLNDVYAKLQTYGCRVDNSGICASNLIPGIYALSFEYGICLDPSTAWKKQYFKLKGGGLDE